jgi:hypothetical protein
MAEEDPPRAEESLARLVEIAEDQSRWQRAAVLPGVRKTIEQTLTSTQLRRAYEMCDGRTTNKEIAAAVKTSKASMSVWTRRWRDLGIAFEAEGGIQHLMSLRSLELPIEVEEK